MANAEVTISNFLDISSALLYLVPKLQLGNETIVRCIIVVRCKIER